MSWCGSRDYSHDAGDCSHGVGVKTVVMVWELRL